MNFLKHLLGLFKDLFGFAYSHKAWWIIPMVLTLLLLFLVIVAGETSAPFIYTLF